jgi:lipoprotein NlpI
MYLKYGLGDSANAVLDDHTNTAFHHMYAGDFLAALNSFSAAAHVNPTSLTAINNYSLCLLYTGVPDKYNVTVAIQQLEAFIKHDPATNLHPALCSNLCTMYELSSDERSALKRKKLLHDLVLRYKGDDFPLKCLKLPTSTS